MLDPKCSWAVRHSEEFPVEVNRAPYEKLLRVPGIGVVSAKRIIRARRQAKLDHEGRKGESKETTTDSLCDVFKIQMNGGRTGLKQTGTTALPSSVFKNHRGCFFVQMDTSAMSKCYPIGSLLLVDPNLKPWNGCSVLALADNSRMVIRRYSTGTNTVMLSSYSYRTSEPDIVLDKRRIRILGVIVWFQASHDLSI